MRRIVTLNALFGYIVLFMVSACNPAPTGLHQLHDYQQRVANTLAVEPVIYKPLTALRAPTARDVQLTIPRLQLSLLDSMRLDTCKAGQLIAERNSALGRLEAGIMRYYNDRKLLAALYECSTQLAQDNPDLAARVLEQAQAKAELMPMLLLQALSNDKSVRNVVSMADRPLAVADSSIFATRIDSLNTVLRVIDTDAELPTESELSAALEQLEKDRYIAQLWRALQENRKYLQQLQPLVAEMSAPAGCLSAGVPTRARVLRQVFINRFSGPVQQHIGELTRQSRQLTPYVEALAVATNAADIWQQHLRQIGALDDQLIDATRSHVEYWQQFFADCNFEPGA
ncbi:DUF3080 family protein [Pseudidiomarina sp.]|uniref:DUF3080 family protein n=1 Tax=Pseudidiomarina sp. TaxID=2081707 RepID=UPI003A96FD18